TARLVKEEISPLMQSGIDSAREKRYQEALNIFKEGYKKGDNFGQGVKKIYVLQNNISNWCSTNKDCKIKI
ncbi:hypothetical protein, partial [Helicobacter bizzozeronii]|uniref:hypothetical protein n=1 Tax=Helicobacter bizzozeronii TaxID=56877 RepID=UPI001315091A